MGKSREDALKSAKESGKKILDGGKEIGQGVRNVTKGTGKSLAFALKGGYHLVDAGDKLIGEKIEEKQKKKGKDTSGKVKTFFRNNIAKTLIATSLLTYGGVESSHKTQDKHEDQVELVVEEQGYLQNPDFFVEDFKVTRDLTYKNQGVELIRDAGMSFYIVQKGDNLISIRKKLGTIPEFSYLVDDEYAIPMNGRNINSFNVPASALQPGMFLPIPVQAENRQIDLNQFKQYCKIALEEMTQNEYYGEQINKMLEDYTEKEIIDVMAAYARSETSQDWSEFSDPIGSVELHRRETGKLNAFSFSYYHILMEHNADGKTMGPGLKAREKLGLTEGQCYHPINAGKLFLGYCCEKNKGNPGYFFNINTLKDAKVVGGRYNGCQTYGNKLWANLNYIRNS